jgi:site-specific DNA-cytosine methylase
MLRVLDLFSCIGGHALGLHAAGGFRTVQFVERDPWRRSVLAQSLGAPHIRRRVFILAHTDLSRLQIAGSRIPSEIDRIARGTADGNPWRAPFAGRVRMADGIPGGVERRRRIEALGDSNPPAMMTVIGRAILRAENIPCRRDDRI